MSNLQSLGNLLGLLLTVTSLVTWSRIFQRRFEGDDPLPSRPREACPWHGAAVALVLPAAYLASAVVLNALEIGDGVTPARIPAVCLALTVQAFVAIGLVSISGPIRKQDLGIDRRHVKTDVRTGGLWFLASWAPVLAVNLLVGALGMRGADEKHPYLKLLDGDAVGATVFWIAVSVLIVAPLVEELLYRVVLQGWLETRLPAPTAVVLVALIFSAIHQKPDYFPMFPLALILGFVYHRLHSYVAVVVLHALFNGANLGMALLMSA